MWLKQVKFNPFVAAENTQPGCTVWVIGWFLRQFPKTFYLCPCASERLQGEMAPCPEALLALQVARCKYEVGWFDQKREAWTYFCVLLWARVKSEPLCWKQKGNNCRVGIKGESETELRIRIVSLPAFGAVLSSGYETVPRIYSCHFWFANLVAEWQVSVSPPRREHPRSCSSAASAGSLSRACLHLRKDADTEVTIRATEAQVGMI